MAEPKSFFRLVPRGDLTKALVLLLFLVGIVVFQRRSGSLVKRMNEGLFGPPPATDVSPKEAPRVRLATPPKTP